MDPKIIAIPIERFEPDRALSGHVFLNLPLNRKLIRIANAGEGLDSSLLAKLIQKGHHYLSVAWNPDFGSDPAHYPVHQEFASSQHIAAETPAPEAEQTSKGPADREETVPEPISNNETESPAGFVQSFQPHANEPEAAQTLSPEPTSEEPSQTFHAESANPEESFRFQANKPEPEFERRISGGQEARDEETFAIKASPRQEEPEFRIGSQLEQARKSLSLEHPEPLDRVKLKEEAKAALIATKASEKILVLSQKVGDLAALEEMGEIMAAFEQAEAGEPLSPVMAESFLSPEDLAAVDQLLAIEDDKTFVEELSQKISASAPVREQARRITGSQEPDSGDLTLTRTRAVRDLPGTASRFAAYLAYALGYTDVRFLTDLSTSAIVYFAKKEGCRVAEESIPELAKLALAPSAPSDSVIDDCRGILEFLEGYFEDPECDIAQKELVKKLVDKTMKKLASSGSLVDGLNAERWAELAKKGPSMDSFSLCSRASAQAIKASRSLVA